MLLTKIHVYFSVGGIYTVIRSKAYVSTEEMGEQYCLLGPYKEHCARTEVEEADFPPGNPLQIAVNKLRDQGFKVRILFCICNYMFIFMVTYILWVAFQYPLASAVLLYSSDTKLHFCEILLNHILQSGQSPGFSITKLLHFLYPNPLPLLYSTFTLLLICPLCKNISAK